MTRHVVRITSAGCGGFTLIELLVSTALAMLIASFTVTAFVQTRNVINRSEALLALNDEAQAIDMLLEKSMGCLQQSCAFAALAVKRTTPPTAEAGSVTIYFVSALEHKDNYQTGSTSGSTTYQRMQTWDRSAMCWEAWRWNRRTGTISNAHNRQMRRNPFEEDTRSFTVANAADQPSSPKIAFQPAGTGTVNFNGSTFRTGAQPRRYLDTQHPFGGPDPTDPLVSRMDDNMWFPDTAAPGYPDPNPTTGITKSKLDDGSSFKITEDVGDYSDLQKALAAPTFSNVIDLCWELVPHDESLPVTRLDDDANATSPATPQVWQGVWLDGRLGVGQTAPLGPPAAFTGSDVARRPRLIRLRFTLKHARTGITQTFCFSYALPGLAPRQ